MHLLGLGLSLFAAFFWLFYGVRVAFGGLRLPWIADAAPAADADCPGISILFAARNEEEKLPAALATLLAIDYPRLEIVAVDDRSSDATGRILEEAARADARLRVVHVRELPRGWLGKPHALQRAYERCSGEWLLFTDADVRFAPDLLHRAVTILRHRGWDHFTLLCGMETASFWERVVVTYFGLGFHLATDPGRVSAARSARYVGVGAFQLLRRGAYEAVGTHKRLALDVVDDMKLAKLVKQAGLRSGVGVGQDFLTVRWQEGPADHIRGVTKNFFAWAGYRVSFVLAYLAGLFLVSLWPFAALLFAAGWTRLSAGVAVAIALCFQAGVALVMRLSPLYAFTHPVGALLFSYMLSRSMVVTLWRGGITWRDTFYPLDELKRGAA